MTAGTVLLLCRAAAHPLIYSPLLLKLPVLTASKSLRPMDAYGSRCLRPAVNLFTIVAETAGADGLKIAETFPEGRGSPHGCGLSLCADVLHGRCLGPTRSLQG
ncbi:hypothetical protein WHV83_23765 [Klebsiella pneumoniae]